MTPPSPSRSAPQPEVSVVIPTRDRWALLATTLGSVAAQQDVVLEIVVVDDGSGSPMPRRGGVWEDPRLRIVRHAVSRGVAAARNAGIGEARGAWIAFLDDDDVWAPGKLRAQLDAAQARGATFAYSAAVLFRADAGAIRRLPAPDPVALRESLRSLNAIPAGASNVVVRAAALGEAGGFDTGLSHLADWDLWIRLAATGAAASCDAAHVGYRLHPGNMRSSSAGGVLRELRALDRKHRHGRVRSAGRLEVYRWLVGGQLLAGRHVAAAWTLALGAVRCRSPAELRRARRLLLATGDPSPPAALGEDGAFGWLAPYVERPRSEAGAASPAAGAQSPPSRRARCAALARPVGTRARRTARRALRPPAARVLERALRMTSLRAGVALVYHEVADGPARARGREVTPVVAGGVFSAQLRLLAARHRVVSAQALPAAVAARRRGERFAVAVTFDDDLRAHVQTALPRLRAAGVTATFFLTGASLEGPSSFWWERLQRAIDADLVAHGDDAMAAAATMQALAPADRDASSADLLQRLGGEAEGSGLRAADVRELAAAGCEIGFHTREHHVLTELDDGELDRALSGGRGELEAAARTTLRAIAYPHGAADARVADAARAAGFAIGFTTAPAAVDADADPLLLGRIYPSSRSSADLGVQLTRVLWRAWRGHG